MAHTPINVGEKLTGPLGQWAVLRFDPSGNYVPGLGPNGVYYAEHWAPWFSGEHADKPADLISHRDRRRVERAIRSWIALSEVPAAIQ